MRKYIMHSTKEHLPSCQRSFITPHEITFNLTLDRKMEYATFTYHISRLEIYKKKTECPCLPVHFLTVKRIQIPDINAVTIVNARLLYLIRKSILNLTMNDTV